MNKTLKFFLYLIAFAALTILTQIGGIALIMGIIACRYLKFSYNIFVLTITAYLILTFIAVPHIAPIFGRERVKNTNNIRPTNLITILLNRNYVNPQLNELLQQTANKLPSEFELRYLDANFPFIDKFPLLPHLSHNDGKKIDISLVYQSSDGSLTNLKPSRSGYGVFVEPTSLEFNQTNECKKMGYFQYDFPKYLTLGTINSDIGFSSENTRILIQTLLSFEGIEKMFVEKHLVQRMNLKDSRIRFQGCQAVRHDDHLHVQVK
ncbi:hypothetical protein [Cyclobacterium qasimii]|uniref:Uncharacterized protein n=2 Tax=Cyclobacterium qasimii TaxID=1350429 RepID=S7VAQ9_9BACT|nr:hypothetical protein [Cyclobacterium qasimii]EPR67071.1 hypothetical protein ADICYQ_3941 [Cyclobacterium qasimii M12-11B]GEO19715.1 hypothetical protein CQA01_02490 [Cyclobacterium qasimii]